MEHHRRNVSAEPGLATPGLTRRSFLLRSSQAVGGLALGPALLAACGGSSSGGDSAGGQAGEACGTVTWETAQGYGQPKVVSGFEPATGCDLKVQYTSDQRLTLNKLAAGNSGISVFQDGGYHVKLTYDRGVLQPIDLDRIPNVKNIIPQFQPDAVEGGTFDGELYCLPFIWGSDSIAYRSDEIDTPTSINALWDPQYKGKISMPGTLLESVFVAAMKLGYDPFTLSDAQLEDCKQALLEQKPLVRAYWTDIGELKNQMATGEVLIAWSWVTTLELNDDGIPVGWAVPEEGQLIFWDGHTIIEDVEGDELQAAYELIDYTLGDEYGAKVGEVAKYRTVSQAAIDKMPADLRKELQLDDPEAFLETGVQWVVQERPAAYEAVWDQVVS